MRETDTEKLREIRRLLDEAYDHYFATSDGYCKPDEGHISLSFGNYWERMGREDTDIFGVDIYSYVLGPHRQHHFNSLDEALKAVTKWHKDEMSYERNDEWDLPLPLQKMLIEGERRP